MEKWQWDERPTEASEERDKELLPTTLSEVLDDLKGFDATERFMKDHSRPSNNEKRGKNHKHVIRGNAKSLTSAAKTDKAKTLTTSVANPEKKHIPDFPWKWDLPDIQSSPVERRRRRKEITKTNDRIDSNHATQETDEKVKELNAQMSWIFEESSESDTETSKSKAQQQNKEEPNEKKGPFDQKFRDHLMKELLKQGKDMNWFVAGAKKALDNLEKGQHAEVPGIKSAVRVSQELNQFLKKSMRPYYQEKRKEKRTRQKQCSSQNQEN